MSPDFYYEWFLGLLYWKNHTDNNAGKYRPQHHISNKPQPLRRTMRSVNRNR